MHPQFAELTPNWFNRAFIYTGSIGEFRYRFDGDKDAGLLRRCSLCRIRKWR